MPEPTDLLRKLHSLYLRVGEIRRAGVLVLAALGALAWWILS